MQQNPPQTLSITWGFKPKWASSSPAFKIYRENQKAFLRFFNLHLTNSYFSSGELYVHSECTNRYRSSLYHSKKFFSFFPCWFSTFWSRRGNETTISLTSIEGSSSLHFLLQKTNKQAEKKGRLKYLLLNSMMKLNKNSQPWVLKPGTFSC